MRRFSELLDTEHPAVLMSAGKFTLVSAWFRTGLNAGSVQVALTKTKCVRKETVGRNDKDEGKR